MYRDGPAARGRRTLLFDGDREMGGFHRGESREGEVLMVQLPPSFSRGAAW